MAWGDPRWFFVDVERLIQRLDDVSADDRHVHFRAKEDLVEAPILEGRRVDWLVESAYVVWVPVDQVMFTEGNQWNFEHARALYDLIRSGARPVLEPPACRLYRIDRNRVVGTQRAYEQDELDYQYGMEKPWEKRHLGSFFVQLLDGNHRALAAIAAGEEQIPVVVGDNYRGDVKKSEWVKAPRAKATRTKRKNMASRRWREDPGGMLERLRKLAALKIEQRRAMGFHPTVDPEDAAQAAMLAELEYRRRGHDVTSAATRGYKALDEEIDRSIAPIELPQTQLREALSPFSGGSHSETRRALRRVDLNQVDLGRAPEERPFFWHEDVVKRAFKMLPYRMREIIKLRYGLSGEVYALRDVAAIFKVSVERIRQLEKLAMQRLQDYVILAQEQERERRRRNSGASQGLSVTSLSRREADAAYWDLSRVEGLLKRAAGVSIGEHLGSGTQGTVYSATSAEHPRSVLKFTADPKEANVAAWIMREGDSPVLPRIYGVYAYKVDEARSFPYAPIGFPSGTHDLFVIHREDLGDCEETGLLHPAATEIFMNVRGELHQRLEDVVMRRAKGRSSLEDYCSRVVKRLEERSPAAGRQLADMCRLYQWLARKGYILFDLHYENWGCRDGRLVLRDFGIAARHGDDGQEIHGWFWDQGRRPFERAPFSLDEGVVRLSTPS